MKTENSRIKEIFNEELKSVILTDFEIVEVDGKWQWSFSDDRFFYDDSTEPLSNKTWFIENQRVTKYKTHKKALSHLSQKLFDDKNRREWAKNFVLAAQRYRNLEAGQIYQETLNG